LIGVVAAVRPDRPQGYSTAWEALCANHDRISKWVDDGLTVVKIGDLLARQGVMVPARILHRYCAARTEYRGRRGGTVPVVDGEPGLECQFDFARMGMLFDPVTGRRRVVHALIFTAVYSRHMFVWLTFSQTLEAVWAELRRLGGRQMPSAAGFAGCGAALTPRFELQLGQGGHDRGNSPSRRGGRVYPFSQGAQRDSTFTKRSDGAGDFCDGSAESVDCGDNHGVAGPGVVEHCGQSRSGCFG
jgi:hypothetical protein